MATRKRPTPLILNIFTLIAILSLQGGVIVAQSVVKQTRAEYVDKYKDIAIKHMEHYGIPASITMAQGLLESSSGNSELSTKSNNHFGIKCKTGWTGRSVRHDDDEAQECFRAYDTVEESYRDHAEFLDSGTRYDFLFNYSHTDYKSWARGLKSAGYATAPHYADMLIKIIEDEKLFLLDYDGGAQMYAERANYSIETFDGTPAKRATVESAQVEQVGSGSDVDVDVIDPDNYRVTINSHKGYDVYRINDVSYVEANGEDSINSIAKAFDVWAYTLRRFNGLKRDDPIFKGERIYLEEMRKSWRGDAATHTVKSGETFESISKLYGVKAHSLERFNRHAVKDNNTLKEGDEIKLRRK